MPRGAQPRSARRTHPIASARFIDSSFLSCRERGRSLWGLRAASSRPPSPRACEVTVPTEMESFIERLEFEVQNTLKLLRTLPEGKYDFRPDPNGRSLGELAWHLAEVEGYMSFGIEQGGFT